jgi:nitrogen fixation/metabolism regulation signal transduction histidine kinase
MYNFAYGLSHEINNPLANIAARARQMFNESTDARHRKSLATMADAAMRAHEMLAEMMLAVKGPTSRLQSGDLRACLLSAAKEWSSLAKEQHLTWRESICDDFLRCRFDRIALFEALSVAIRNAVEACRPGDTVEFVAERFESERGQLEIRLAILDNGSGLSEESLQHAWDLYYCGREAGRGLGIGLCKLRRVIEDHSGRVWLDSKARAGCTVEIRLPWDYRQKP